MIKYYKHTFKCPSCGKFTVFDSQWEGDPDEHVFCDHCDKVAEWWDTDTIENADAYEMSEMIK